MIGPLGFETRRRANSGELGGATARAVLGKEKVDEFKIFRAA